MDQAFNQIHGDGTQLKDNDIKDPIMTTVHKIQELCPNITFNAIKLFTKVKYHMRVRDLNEKDLIEKVAKRKNNASEKNGKRIKTMCDFIKTGHFMSI